MTVRQFEAWTWGSLDPSVSCTPAGILAILISSFMIISMEMSCVFADKIAVMMDGIPADRRVVEACVKMQLIPPWSGLAQHDRPCLSLDTPGTMS